MAPRWSQLVENEASRWAIWKSEGLSARGLSWEEASALVHASPRSGLLVPEEYFTGARDIAEALPIAEAELDRGEERARARHGQNLTFRSTEFVDENPLWWSFRRGCVELQKAGWIPGAATCRVDKLDLHVWSPEEADAFAAVHWRF